MALTRRPVSCGSLKPTAAIAASRFVQLGGIQSAAGQYTCGVSHYAGVANGDYIPFTELGREIVETGGAFVVGQLLESDAQGRAILRTAGVIVGRAVTASTAVGQFAEIYLIPN
jgi:uncharacterized protein YbjQ (UPF0145 family)